MRTLQTALAVAFLVVCVLGYAGSQYAYWAGSPARWSASLDDSSVPYLATAMCLGLAALVLAQEGEGET
jgi:hypothetical protein